MSTFSLLQVSLDQRIERDFFIEAASATESVTKADLSQIYRDLFGIVVSNLSHADAMALQAELARKGFPTEVVADAELPALHEPKSMQRVTVDGGWLRFTDIMSRSAARALGDLVFLAGGFLKNAKMTSKIVGSPRSNSGDHDAAWERVHQMKEVAEFRLDFFFASEPNRMTLVLGPERAIFVNEKALQVQKKAVLGEVAAELRKLLPPERMNRGLLDTGLCYPSGRAYVEEIRWHFHQLIKSC